MPVEKVPQTYVWVCDRCRARTETQQEGRPSQSGIADLVYDGLDYQGHTVGPGGLKVILCYPCIVKLDHVIREWRDDFPKDAKEPSHDQ